MKTGIIYKATSPIGKCYIGQTQKTLKERKWGHFSSNTCKAFRKALDKYGDKMHWEVLRECPVECLDAWEQIEILRCNSFSPNGYNLSHGGEAFMRGRNQSEKTKQKIGDSQRGEKNHNYGKKASKETRQKMSESHSGKHNAFYGKRHSEETRRLMSEKAKGRIVSEKTRRKISNSMKKRFRND